MAQPSDAVPDVWEQRLASLRQRLKRRIQSKFYNMLPAWEQLSGDLDDLLSEVEMAFLKSTRAGKFTHDAEDGILLAWLQTVAGNKLKDVYRKWQKRGANARLDARREQTGLSLAESLAGPGGVEKEAESKIICREVWEIAERAFLDYDVGEPDLARLQRLAVRLVFMDGNAILDVATAVRCRLSVAESVQPSHVEEVKEFLCDGSTIRHVIVAEIINADYRDDTDDEETGGHAAVPLHQRIADKAKQVTDTVVANAAKCCGSEEFAGTDIITSRSARYLALRLHLNGLGHTEVCKAVAKIGRHCGLECSPSAVNNWLSYSHGSSAWRILADALVREGFESVLVQLVDALVHEQGDVLTRELDLNSADISLQQLRDLLALYCGGKLDEYAFKSPGEKVRILALVEAAHELLVGMVTDRLAEHLGKERPSDASAEEMKTK